MCVCVCVCVWEGVAHEYKEKGLRGCTGVRKRMVCVLGRRGGENEKENDYREVLAHGHTWKELLNRKGWVSGWRFDALARYQGGKPIVY